MVLNGIIGNQVRNLSDPVTVTGSLHADAIGDSRAMSPRDVSEKAHVDDDLEPGSLPVWD